MFIEKLNERVYDKIEMQKLISIYTRNRCLKNLELLRFLLLIVFFANTL